MSGLEVRQLTVDSLGFSSQNLQSFLQANNPYDHLAIRPTSGPPPDIAAIPGRPDILLRWQLGRNILLDDRLEQELVCGDSEVPGYVSIFERELGRLASFGIGIPGHTHYFVPEDPYNNTGTVYTTVERLANDQSLTYQDLRDPDSVHHNTAIQVKNALVKYYREPACEAWYIDELFYIFQVNTDKKLFEVGPVLVNGNTSALQHIQKYA